MKNTVFVIGLMASTTLFSSPTRLLMSRMAKPLLVASMGVGYGLSKNRFMIRAEENETNPDALFTKIKSKPFKNKYLEKLNRHTAFEQSSAQHQCDVADIIFTHLLAENTFTFKPMLDVIRKLPAFAQKYPKVASVIDKYYPLVSIMEPKTFLEKYIHHFQLSESESEHLKAIPEEEAYKHTRLDVLAKFFKEIQVLDGSDRPSSINTFRDSMAAVGIRYAGFWNVPLLRRLKAFELQAVKPFLEAKYPWLIEK